MRGIKLAKATADADFDGTEVWATRASLLWAPALAICATAFAVEIPFFFFGIPSGHDLEFHLYAWLDALSQWRQAIFLPRWAAMSHFGFGEPTFLFYPPSSWTLGVLLSAVFPWTIVTCVYIWLALTFAGISMFLLARRWLRRSDAIFAAILYAANPYHLVIVYWRSAFAELLASCLLPLLLLLVIRLAENERHVVVPLALVLALAWLTNAPAAVMIHYSFALLALLIAWQKRSPWLLQSALVAVLLGACLSAFYLFPAIYEQKWVTINGALSAGYRPQDNFLFIHTGDRDHDAFNHLVTWVAMFEMVVSFVAAWAARKWYALRHTTRILWNSLFAWSFACGVLMFPVTALAWRFLPKLEFMQFPWRWLLCLSMAFSFFTTTGFMTTGGKRWAIRIAVCAASLLVIAGAWRYLQSPWWDHSADLLEMQDNMTSGTGYEGVNEYTPLGADPSVIDKDAPDVAANAAALATVQIVRWNSELKMFTAEVSEPGELTLRLFRYPAWRAKVNGHVVETLARPDTGQMVVPVSAGMNQVEINFVRTWDRTLGAWISVITSVGLVVWWAKNLRIVKATR